MTHKKTLTVRAKIAQAIGQRRTFFMSDLAAEIGCPLKVTTDHVSKMNQANEFSVSRTFVMNGRNTPEMLYTVRAGALVNQLWRVALGMGGAAQ